MKSQSCYGTISSALVLAAICITVTGAFSPCSISKSHRGSWGVFISYDGVNYDNQFNITMTTNNLLGYQLEQFPALIYDCYSKGRYSLAFRSEQALFFNTYDVRVFFCWYLIKVNSKTYNIVELTSRVLDDSDERAKAYLEPDSLPDDSLVCEIPYNRREGLYAPYRQLRKIVSATWS